MSCLHIIGVDGGLQGGLASFLCEDDPADVQLVALHMPLEKVKVAGKERDRVSGPAIRDFFHKFSLRFGRPDAIYLEEAVGVRGQSAARAANFGVSVGIVEGVAHGLQIPVHLVKAVIWKRHPSINLIGEGKNASRSLAGRLFPRALPAFRLHEDDGVAEAALIAYYGWLTERATRA